MLNNTPPTGLQPHLRQLLLRPLPRRRRRPHGVQRHALLHQRRHRRELRDLSLGRHRAGGTLHSGQRFLCYAQILFPYLK